MKKYIFLLTVLLSAQSVRSQIIENTSVQILGENMIVTFDLMPKESVKELYEITLYVHDKGQSKEITVKDGSLENVRPANQIQYTISGKENFKNIRGEIDISIVAKMTYSPLNFISPQEGQVMKRGSTSDLKWRGGIENDKYTLELYKSNSKIALVQSDFVKLNNSWDIPKNTKPGKSYQLRLGSINHPEQSAMTAEFRIRRKIPLVVKVVPVLALVGVAAVLVKNSSDGENDTLPNPPDLPGQ